jgi:hypothetical protein
VDTRKETGNRMIYSVELKEHKGQVRETYRTDSVEVLIGFIVGWVVGHWGFSLEAASQYAIMIRWNMREYGEFNDSVMSVTHIE